MPIKQLNKIKIRSVSPTKSGDVPVVLVEGTDVKKFNDAVAAEKAAKVIVEDERPDLLETGLAEFLRLRLADQDPSHPVKSVYLQDESGAQVLYSFVATYSVIDGEAVEAYLDGELGVDSGEYAEEAVVAAFDASVFKDAAGNFNENLFNRFQKLLDAAAASCKIVNPLTSKKVVKVKPTFHEKRFTDAALKSVEVQQRLCELMPNTQSLKPLVPKEAKAK